MGKLIQEAEVAHPSSWGIVGVLQLGAWFTMGRVPFLQDEQGWTNKFLTCRNSVWEVIQMFGVERGNEHICCSTSAHLCWFAHYAVHHGPA